MGGDVFPMAEAEDLEAVALAKAKE